MPVEFNEKRLPVASGEGWTLDFDRPAKGCFTLKVGKDLILETGGVSFEDLSEKAAIHGRRRCHLSEDGRESSLDVSCTIPFGAEPAVERRYTLIGNRLAVRTDLIMRNSHRMTEINSGELRVSGNLAKAGVLYAGKKGSLPEIVWKTPDKVPEFSFDSGIPLCVLAESVSGAVLELAAGEDLWRWNQANSLDGKNSFSLEFKRGILTFDRVLYLWNRKPDAEPPSGRNWRLGSAFAWSPSGIGGKKGRLKKAKASFDLSAYDWPESCLAAGPDGTPVKGLPCFASEQTVNILKRWVRSTFGDLKDGDVIRATHAELCACWNASHQDRPKKGTLLHWDADPMMDFRRWAERQTAVYGASFELIPEKGGILASLLPGTVSR